MANLHHRFEGIRRSVILSTLAAVSGICLAGAASAQSACEQISPNPQRGDFDGGSLVLTGLSLMKYTQTDLQGISMVVDGSPVSQVSFVNPNNSTHYLASGAANAGAWLMKVPPHSPGKVSVQFRCPNGSTSDAMEFRFSGAPSVDLSHGGRQGGAPFEVRILSTEDYTIPYSQPFKDAYVAPRNLAQLEVVIDNGTITGWTTRQGTENDTHKTEQVLQITPAHAGAVTLSLPGRFKCASGCDSFTMTIPANAAATPSKAPPPVEKLDLKWSSAGVINGLICDQWLEGADPDTWNDNFLCSTKEHGFRFNSAGPLANMDCISVNEAADPHTWNDNFFCTPKESPYQFVWYTAGLPQNAGNCVHIHEASDPHTWNDNYLCWSLK